VSEPSGTSGCFIDSHCHLTMEAFDTDREQVLDRARQAGVTSLMVISSSLGDTRSLLDFVQGHPGSWGAAGVHPHEAKGYDETTELEIRDVLADHRIVAVGEIGLDYHYDHSPRETQREVFRRQLKLARDLSLPVVIHTREAKADMIRILEEEGAPSRGGVFHCFTEDAETAAWAIDNDFFVSFSGVLTFRNAGALRAVARGVPLERTLIETDAPFLAPAPMRGRRNEPAFVRHVAACLADIHGASVQDIGRMTSESFFRLFGITPTGTDRARDIPGTG
jgi:TatD DNase family protein